MRYYNRREIIREAAKELDFIKDGCEQTGYATFERSCYNRLDQILPGKFSGEPYRIPAENQELLVKYLILRQQGVNLETKSIREKANKLKSKLSVFRELIRDKKKERYEALLAKQKKVTDELIELAEESLA